MNASTLKSNRAIALLAKKMQAAVKTMVRAGLQLLFVGAGLIACVVPIYYDGESVKGIAVIRVPGGKAVKHDGIKIEFVGSIGEGSLL